MTQNGAVRVASFNENPFSLWLSRLKTLFGSRLDFPPFGQSLISSGLCLTANAAVNVTTNMITPKITYDVRQLYVEMRNSANGEKMTAPTPMPEVKTPNTRPLFFTNHFDKVDKRGA